MSTRPVATDPSTTLWFWFAGAIYLTLLVGAQVIAVEPGPALFAVTLAFFAIPAAFLGAVCVCLVGIVKIIFE